MTATGGTSRDGFLGNKLTIEQPAIGAHRAGLDAVLLAAALPDGTAGQVVDLGAGVGIAGSHTSEMAVVGRTVTL